VKYIAPDVLNGIGEPAIDRIHAEGDQHFAFVDASIAIPRAAADSLVNAARRGRSCRCNICPRPPRG